VTDLPPQTPAEGRDLSVPIERIATQAAGMSLALLLVPLAVYALTWGWRDLFSNYSVLGFPLAAVGLVLAHEGFHAIGWKYAGNLRWSDLEFGFAWKALAPYCHAKAPLRADAYRFGAALPGVMTGLLPFGWALLNGNGMWAVLGAVMISGAVGDIVVLRVISELPADAIVKDHPSQAGCIVVDEGTPTT